MGKKRDEAVRCARCGEQRQQGGFRYFAHAVGYCDPCFKKPGPWPLGQGFYDKRVVWEGF